MGWMDRTKKELREILPQASDDKIDELAEYVFKKADQTGKDVADRIHWGPGWD